MPAPTAGADSYDSVTPAPAMSACGYRWTAGMTCDAGPEHSCARTSPDHRSHMCRCEAVELRTAAPVGTSRVRARPL
jgi:hypothetical protein